MSHFTSPRRFFSPLRGVFSGLLVVGCSIVLLGPLTGSWGCGSPFGLLAVTGLASACLPSFAVYIFVRFVLPFSRLAGPDAGGALLFPANLPRPPEASASPGPHAGALTAPAYNIRKEPTSRLVSRLRGGMQIFARTLSGNSITVDVEASDTDTIDKVKAIRDIE
jgi:hypothetical protein